MCRPCLRRIAGKIRDSGRATRRCKSGKLCSGKGLAGAHGSLRIKNVLGTALTVFGNVFLRFESWMTEGDDTKEFVLSTRLGRCPRDDMVRALKHISTWTSEPVWVIRLSGTSCACPLTAIPLRVSLVLVDPETLVRVYIDPS